MNRTEIQTELFRHRDVAYQRFQARLLPTLEPSSIIGVRTPILRDFAKTLSKKQDVSEFLKELPHQYFEENQLHAFLISEIKAFDRCIEELNSFLPFVDNWATCDQMLPKAFNRHKKELLEQIPLWLASENPYTLRFAVGMLMRHFLDESFDLKYPKMILEIHSEEYYVNMMIAWYFATALAKQYPSILPIFEQKNLKNGHITRPFRRLWRVIGFQRSRNSICRL